MSALVTGASGFVGSNLVRRLLKDGEEVHILLRPEHAEWRLRDIPGNLRRHLVDLGNREEVGLLLTEIGPDSVYHLSAYGAYPRQTDLAMALATNVIALSNLLESCEQAGVRVFVNAGSSSEYGAKDHAPGEEERVEPNSAYAISKVAATHVCHNFALHSNLKICTLRLYSVYGPFEEPSRFVPTLLTHGIEGKYPPLVNPNVSRDFVYIDDVIQAFLLCAANPPTEKGAVFNIGSGDQTTIREAVEICRQIFTINDQPVWGSMPSRSWDTHVWVSNSARAAATMGWKAKIGTLEGFSRVADWLRNPEILEFYRSRIFR